MRSLRDITRRTERMTLRPLRADDEEEFSRVVLESRDAWAPWTPAGSPGLTRHHLFRRELDRTVLGAESGTHLRLAGFDHAGTLVGLFALNEIVRGVFESAYGSWQVRAGRMGEGFATEGVRALLSLAFEPAPGGVGLHRVQANIMPSNASSMRVAEKVGFRREGVATRYLKIAGKWEDHVMFALTREEWRGGE